MASATCRFTDCESVRRVESGGVVVWRLDGKLHRVDGPAVEFADGSRDWRRDGRLHREGGPAVEIANGDRAWYEHGQLHRTDGPAIEYANGERRWFQHGQLHRTDGPAVEFADGSCEWWLGNRRLGYDIVVWLTVAEADRELVAELYRRGADMVAAVAAARRIG